MKLDFPKKKNSMYVISADEFDIIAGMVLKEYDPHALERPQPVDIDFITGECMYLVVEDVYLTANATILGMISSEDTEIPRFDGCYKPGIDHVNAGTMLLDASLLGRDQYPRRRFTNAHEMSHWIVHRSYRSDDKRSYEFRTSNALPFIACQTENVKRCSTNNRHNMTDNNWEEWQADHLAAALLMPRDTFVGATKNALREHGLFQSCLVAGKDQARSHEVISNAARTFHVSKKATQIRMRQLMLIKEPADFY